MPRSFQGYEPDSIDCAALVTALGEDFGCVAQTTVRFDLDRVTVICKTRRLGEAPDSQVITQSLVSRPLKGSASLYTLVYSALLDCWHQLDRGVLAAAARPIERGWSGRPQTPRRRT